MTAKRTLSLIALLLFIAGIVYAAVYVRSHGFSAKEEPTWYERWLARRARRIATPSDAKGLKNPNPASEAALTEAREHFVEHCSVCHGLDGRGNTTFGKNMYPKVPDMTDDETQRLTDGELFYIINNGVRFTGMPAFGAEDSPQSIWDLVSFIRRLPTLSPEELRELQKLAGEEAVHEEGEGQQKSDADEAAGKPKPPVTKPRAKPHSHGSGTKPHSHRP